MLAASSNTTLLVGVSDATVLLEAVEQGDPEAPGRLLELVYTELRHLAASKMAREAPGHTLQPCVGREAWLRLVGAKNMKFENRAQFFSAAAEAMRRILIERVRRKRAQRHGGDFVRVDVGTLEFAAPDQDQRLLDVHEVLDKFTAEHPIHAKVVMLRYFVGMTNEETSEILGLSVATVKNYWTFARTWLFHEIKNS